VSAPKVFRFNASKPEAESSQSLDCPFPPMPFSYFPPRGLNFSRRKQKPWLRRVDLQLKPSVFAIGSCNPQVIHLARTKLALLRFGSDGRQPKPRNRLPDLHPPMRFFTELFERVSAAAWEYSPALVSHQQSPASDPLSLCNLVVSLSVRLQLISCPYRYWG
jgi:hypothetical protein